MGGMSGMKRALIFLVKFAAAALVTFVCFELYFRTTEISLPSFVYDDPVIGRAWKPNARTALIQEGLYMGRINEYGCLGPSYPPEKKEGTLRIALVGDSYVEGFQVFPRWNLRSVLEKELSQYAGRPVEVLNFGLSGHTIRTMFAYEKDRVSRFHPDITMFFINRASFGGRDHSLGPQCYLDPDGHLKVNYDFAQSNTFKRKTQLNFTRKFGSYQMLQSAFARFREGQSTRILLGKFAPRKPVESRKAPADETKDPKFGLNKAVIEELARIDRSGRTHVVFVGHKHVPPYYARAIEEAGLTYVDIQPALDELARSGTDPYYWPVTNSSGHWNHEGQQFIGKYLARWLLETEPRVMR